MNPEQEQVIQSLHTEIDRILQLSIYQMRKLELIALFKNLQLRAERAEQEMRLLADIREQDLFLYLTLKKEQDDLQSKLSVAKEECAAANKGAKVNALINKSLVDKLSIAEQKIEEMRESEKLLASVICGKCPLDYLNHQFPATVGHTPLIEFLDKINKVRLILLSTTQPTDWVRRSEVEKIVNCLLDYASHAPICPMPASECDCGYEDILTLAQSFLKNKI